MDIMAKFIKHAYMVYPTYDIALRYLDVMVINRIIIHSYIIVTIFCIDMIKLYL